MIGGDRVAQHRQHARAENVGDRRGRLRHAVEVRRLADVGRVGLPLVNVAGGKAQALPVRVALAHGRVLLAEALAAEALLDGRGNFLLRGPDVLEIDGLAGFVLAQRIGVEVVADPAGERVGHDQRRAHQVVRAHVDIHAALEVAIAAEAR